MPVCSPKHIARIIACLFAVLPSGTFAANSKVLPDYLSASAVHRERQSDVVDPAYLSCLAQHPADPVKVWVFFTDKGFTDKTGFTSAASSVALTERSARRRAKVGLDKVVFADLPVAEQYVREIENLGAVHRRSSRWLNAASFEIESALVERVAKLPFVSEIKPLTHFRQAPEDTTSSTAVPRESARSANALNYGNSYAQLNQIGVPPMHDLGYSGHGVTLALLDSGFRKSHEAFAAHFAEGRVLAEYDFVHNDGNTDSEPTDSMASQPNHGTMVWSVAAGLADGNLYGPAYHANFILCETEDIRSELPIEEDNWVAGMEFSDSVGADVITTSLGYRIFDASCSCDYSYSDMDGRTATTSIAASMADGLGIVLCKSAGNEGPGVGSISAPADAFDILAVGSVDAGGTIAYNSGRGPTYDGRIKPEVCARGLSTWCAHPTVSTAYTYGSGTSFAAPLVAGAACLLIEAHPDWNPHQVREALKMSGDHSVNPDNTYGWGIINVDSANRSNPGCCAGIVGNINGLGGDIPTLGDISALIDYKFITLTPIPCLAEADINQSGGANPGPEDITIGDIAILIDYLFITGPTLGLPNCL